MEIIVTAFLVAFGTSLVVNRYFYHQTQKQLDKWVEQFFEEEVERLVTILSRQSKNHVPKE
ncbi:hypothetical protein ACRW9N_10835 [Listeria aquatica]|uniref:hypothetical protein n=1 Tax=Listeria aquatica TaxID=1494960 RepID=UPI003EF5F33E